MCWLLDVWAQTMWLSNAELREFCVKVGKDDSTMRKKSGRWVSVCSAPLPTGVIKVSFSLILQVIIERHNPPLTAAGSLRWHSRLPSSQGQTCVYFYSTCFILSFVSNQVQPSLTALLTVTVMWIHHLHHSWLKSENNLFQFNFRWKRHQDTRLYRI